MKEMQAPPVSGGACIIFEREGENIGKKITAQGAIFFPYCQDMGDGAVNRRENAKDKGKGSPRIG